MEKMEYKEFIELKKNDKKAYLSEHGLQFKNSGSVPSTLILKQLDNINLSKEDKMNLLIKTAKLFYSGNLIHVVFSKYQADFTDEEKRNLIKNLGMQGMEIFNKFPDLFTDEEKKELIKSYGSSGKNAFKFNINIFTEEEKKKLIRGFGFSGIDLFKENSEIYTDEEKKEYINKLGFSGIELFKENSEIYTDEEKKEYINKLGSSGIEFFKENSEIYSYEEKKEYIKSLGSKGLEVLEVYPEILTFEEKMKYFGYFLYTSRSKVEFFRVRSNIFTDEEKKEYIKGLGYQGKTFFKENIDIYTDEEKKEYIKSIGNLGIEFFKENIDIYTDEEKKEYIKSLGKLGIELFEENLEIYTDEEKREFIINGEAIGLLRKYIDILTDEQKKIMLKKFGVFDEKIFEKYLYLLTTEEIIDVFLNSGNKDLFSNEYISKKILPDLIKEGKGSEVIDIYLVVYRDWQKKDRIYDFLNKFGKQLKKEEMEKLLLGVYPEGNALQFYNKLNYLPNEIILDKYPADQIDKFDKKIWMRLSKMDLFYETYETKSAFIEMALSLGIFEKDDKVNERIAFIEKLANFLPKEYEFTGDISELGKLQEAFRVKSQKDVRVDYKYQDHGMWFLDANGHNKSDKLWCFKDLEQQREAYRQMFEFGDTISEELFKELIAADYYSDNYANAMEFFVNQVYKRREIKDYQVYFKYDFNKLNKENKAKAIRLQKELRKFYWSRERKDMMTPDKLHRIFDGMDMKYKPGFFEFFKNNLREILAQSDKQQVLAKIQRNWEKIVETNLGQRITFEKCEKYFMENTYENVVTEADKEIAKLSLQSGYTQEQFDIARQIYEEQRARKKSSIPLIEEKDGKNGYRYKVLRLDDPTTIFVGELTNCCQAIDNAGESCMRHSATSENGRVLVVLDESGKVLSQSWLWRNQNVLCFDNIEAVEKDKENRKVVGKEILDTVIRAAEEFLEVDKVKMEEWKKQQKELLIRKLQNKEITQEEYNSRMNRVEEQVDAQMLSKVTVGQGYTDVSLAGLERDNEDAYPIELVSYTADSRTQFVLASTTNRIIPKDGEFSTISLYEDGEEYKKIIEIDTSEIGDDSYEDDYQEDFEEYDEQEQNGNGFMGYDEPHYDSGEFGNDEYQSRIPENPYVIVFRDEVYRDDTEFYFDIEEKFVREDIKKKQNRFYSKSKKRNKSLSELVEEKKELDKKLEEARKLEREYARLAEARARGGRE